MAQTELARRAGTSQPTISAYESGDKVPTAATLERVLEAAGATLSTSRSTGRRRRGHLLRLLHDRSDEIQEAAATHHAGNVRVFGSVARGEETDRSDIDQVRLHRALSQMLGVSVDVVASGGLLERGEAIPI